MKHEDFLDGERLVMSEKAKACQLCLMTMHIGPCPHNTTPIDERCKVENKPREFSARDIDPKDERKFVEYSALEQANLKIQQLEAENNTYAAELRHLNSKGHFITDEQLVEAQEAVEKLESAQARIADLEAENEFLQAEGVHTCSNQCRRAFCVMRRKLESAQLEIQEHINAGLKLGKENAQLKEDCLLLSEKIQALEAENKRLLKESEIDLHNWERDCQERDALKSENERLNKYVIAGHQQIEAEMKSEIERLAKQNESLTIERDYWKQEYQHESENRAAMMIERDQYKTALGEFSDSTHYDEAVTFKARKALKSGGE